MERPLAWLINTILFFHPQYLNTAFSSPKAFPLLCTHPSHDKPLPIPHDQFSRGVLEHPGRGACWHRSPHAPRKSTSVIVL